MTGFRQYAADGAIAASRFPDRTPKAFNGEQRTGGFRRRRIKVERGAAGPDAIARPFGRARMADEACGASLGTCFGLERIRAGVGIVRLGFDQDDAAIDRQRVEFD